MILSNPAAAGAGQIASVSRFEHQNEGKPLDSTQFLADKVTCHRNVKTGWKTHQNLDSLDWSCNSSCMLPVAASNAV
jgi:hypothetical protein